MSILNYPTARTLGENDFFYVVQGSGDSADKKATFKQLPIATTTMPGLMSENDRSFISSLKTNIPAGYSLVAKNAPYHYDHSDFIVYSIGVVSAGAPPIFSVVSKNNVAPVVMHIGGNKGLIGYNLFYKLASDGMEFWVYSQDSGGFIMYLSGQTNTILSNQIEKPEGLIDIIV